MGRDPIFGKVEIYILANGSMEQKRVMG